MQAFELDTLIHGMVRADDLEIRKLNLSDETVDLVYFSTMCDKKYIHTAIIKTILDRSSLSEIELALKMLPGFEIIQSEDQMIEKLIGGYTLLFFPQMTCAIEAKKDPTSQPQETSIENILQGPQFAFSEDLATNIQILRTRYPSQDLHIEFMKIGTQSQTELAIIYDKTRVDEDVLLQLENKLMSIDAEVIQAANQLQMLLTKRYQFLPTLMITERPDRTVLNLSKGKIALLLNGTPFSVNLPAVFFDFMASMDDVYELPWIVRPLQILRFIGMFITTSLPALYVATVSYNPEFFRSQIAIEIAGSRAAVPYPSFYEVFLMLFLIEALTEASIRLPKFIGSTATTVGGLILGQAAQQAGLVSSIMIIIASAVAISNFVIPMNTLGFSLRVIKFPLVLLAIFFGLVGVLAGLFCFLVYTVSLRSFGRPYLKLFIGEDKKTR
ncbi:spore germination protein [Paenibacillus sp. yr247]|uniref:spore germination protein n=1 Tax=Paenibacillus sp. yr247 TaxID=1761880 RepID=UPI000892575C|nr:spore germination protein [Paenibacillus sp. yr247]SDO22216.1 spore germination protein [Paenibacillus sp. yr247]